MNKSKTKKLALLTTVILVISVFSFIPTVQAKTSERPIMDWLQSPPFFPPFGNAHSLGWIDDTGLFMWPHFDYPRNIWAAEHPIWDCLSYNGYVLERELTNNMIMITIYLKVDGVPFHMTYGDPVGPLIFEGMMHYTFRWNMIIDLDLYPPILKSDGKILYAPLILYINPVMFPELFNSVVAIGNIHFNGAGTGVFKADYGGWLNGESAKVKVNEVGLVKDFDPDKHPVMEDYGFWPVEFSFFH